MYSAAGCLDLDWLAYTLFLHEQNGVNMSVQVAVQEGLAAARAHGR